MLKARPPAGRRRPGAVARAPDGAGLGAGAGEQDRTHPRDGGKLFIHGKPAQSDLADAASARLGDETADLSDRAAKPACSRIRSYPTTRSRWPRSAPAVTAAISSPATTAATCASRTTGPRATPTAAPAARYAAARAGELRQHGDRSPARWRHQCGPGKESRRGLRDRNGRQNLHRLRPLLSVRSWRPAGPHDRSRRLLCGGRQRRSVAAAARVSSRSRRTATRCFNIRIRRCRSSPPPTMPPSISSRPCCRVSWRAAPRVRSAACRRTSPARPARPKTRSTDGSSALPTT